MGAGGVSDVVKVPELDKIADFGPHLGGVDPHKIVSQLKSIPF